MEQKFDKLVYDWLAPTNKYVVGSFFALFVMYTVTPTLRNSPFIRSFFRNLIVQIVFVFASLVILQRLDAMTALYISVTVVILFYILSMFMSEHMASVEPEKNTVPPFSYTVCNNDPKQWFDEKAESPVTNVSEAEMQSLCQHLKHKNNFACPDIAVPPEFSELVSHKACAFAKHQFINKNPDVKCNKNISENSEVFSTLAPVA